MTDDLQRRLSQFESEPPKAAWNRIASALDQQDLSGLGKKLSGYEELPPGNIWSKIITQLDRKTPATGARVFHIPAWAKIGTAAAVVISILVFGEFFRQSEDSSQPSFRDVVKQQNQLRNWIPSPNDQGSIPQENEQTASQEKQIVAYQVIKANKRNASFSALIQEEMIKEETPLLSEELVENLIPEKAERQSSLAFNFPVDKYMVYSRTDGQPVRLPKKLFDAVACIEEDIECRKNLKKVQEKFAASALTADFAGVLELLNNLGENQ